MTTAFAAPAFGEHHARPADVPAPARGARRAAAGLLGAQFVTMWGAFFILAPSINWPASLDEPASVTLPLIAKQSVPVFAGYLSYLVHILLLAPLAVVLRETLRMGPGPRTPRGGRSGRSPRRPACWASCAGCFLMPALSAAWLDPEASAATRDAIAVVFDAFNALRGAASAS